MARLWTELRSELVADGRLDERRVAAAKVEILALLREREIAEMSDAAGAAGQVQKVRGARQVKVNGTTVSVSLIELAARVMQDPRASKIQKSLASSILARREVSCEDSVEVMRKAEMVLRGKRFAERTRRLAASVMVKSREEG